VVEVVVKQEQELLVEVAVVEAIVHLVMDLPHYKEQQ